MQNSMVVLTFSVLDQEYAFWAPFVLKANIASLSLIPVQVLIRISRIRWLFTIFRFLFLFFWDRTYPFLVNMVKKIKLASFSWNLVLRLTRICRIQWWCLLFLFLTKNTLFGCIWFKCLKLLFKVKFDNSNNSTNSNMQNSMAVLKYPLWANLVQ